MEQGEGPLFTRMLTGAASSKLVEAYRVHPNAIKALPRCGQGYGAAHVGYGGKLLPTDGATPVCYPRLPKALLDGCDYPLKRNDQSKARSLRLDQRFVEEPQERKSG